MRVAAEHRPIPSVGGVPVSVYDVDCQRVLDAAGPDHGLRPRGTHIEGG